MKILTILGARPQFIKAGSVSRAIMEHNRKVEGSKLEVESIDEVIVHTGQHYDTNMSDVFFEEMKIPKPDYFLGIGGKSHGAMTGQMMEKIEEVAMRERPDWMLVYGDTDSTLAGALVASKLHIPLAHVESGLRSYNMRMPEEINRILTDRVSDLLFCPTDTAVENLRREGFGVNGGSGSGFGRVLKVGDVMQDGAMFYRRFSRRPKAVSIESDYILATVHRAENTDDETRLRNIMGALEEIARERPVILPLHPRTKKRLAELSLPLKSVTVIDPVGYLEMVWLLDRCSMVMTDSGGLQKEAYFFHRPCITLREETEWVELVENRFNVLASSEKETIIDAYKNYEFNEEYDVDLYGSGKAGDRIVNLMVSAGASTDMRMRV